MPDFYLVRCADGTVSGFSEQGHGKWFNTRLPQLMASKTRHVLHHGAQGWLVQDQSPGMHGSCCIAVPIADHAHEDGAQPPTGSWWSADGRTEYMLTSARPTYPPMDSQMSIEVPFVRCTFTREGPASRMDVRMFNRPITDECLDKMLPWGKTVLLELGRRPEMFLMLMTDLTESGVPAMKHVKRFMAWAKEVGDLMNLSIRGNAIVLKPTGFMGQALVGIIKMLQRILQATWPETLVPTREEADTFLAQHQPVSDSVATGLDPAEAAQAATDTSMANTFMSGAVQRSSNNCSDLERQRGSGSPGSTCSSGTTDGSLASASTAAAPSEAELTFLQFVPGVHTATEPRNGRGSSTSALLGRANGVGDNPCRPSRQSGAAVGKHRSTRTSSIAPELARLDVPVWVDMGYRPGPRLGYKHPKVKDMDVIEPGAQSAPLLEMCGGCSRVRRFPADPPQPRRCISQFSV